MTDSPTDPTGVPPTEPAPSGPTKCGYVAILGAPNAGKSTLLNRLVGAKLSIVSPKVQTTRTRVLGIQVLDAAQIIYIDTPGIFRPKRRLDRAMVAAAWSGAADADVVLLLVDAEDGLTEEVKSIVSGLKDAGRRAVLALNKIDATRHEKLLQLASALDLEGIFDRIFMISGLSGDGVADVEKYLLDRLPLGHWLFPEDQLSDVPQRLLAAEVTREQLFLQLHDELPYETTVETESWEELKDGSVKISQIVYVQRPSQKAIVLGKGGRQIKRLGERSRLEFEKMLEQKVHLFLFVKVREDWAEDRERYAAIGLEFDH
ncbi:MAG TPA: GTPase Era [Aliidongia sp.]|uniref:GTPase Era n=1 Tax=Aliidongia sp. TaxID=1914230 RepID=UPI002DDCB3D1|nr:GTPase Era [Aliidongia sp.]HEV2678039.1 GTPase Era [Aliidongia sp.]